MKIAPGLFLLFFLTVCFSNGQAVETAKNVISWDTLQLENIADNGNIHKYNKGYTEVEKHVYLCDNGTDPKEGQRGVCLSSTLNQKKPIPILATLTSKAEEVGGSKNNDYALYIDVVYDDGSCLWGQCSPFTTGTHDWELKKVLLVPSKPIRSLSMYGLFRNHTGKAWFKDFTLKSLTPNDNLIQFDAVPVLLPKKQVVPFDGKSVQLRDVAKNTDFVYLGSPESGKLASEAEALGITVRTNETKDKYGTTINIELISSSQEDRALTFVYSINLATAENMKWYNNPRQAVQVEKNHEYINVSTFPVGGSGRLSKYPFGVVEFEKDGHKSGAALGIAPDAPCLYRVGYNSSSNELYLNVDLALTKEVPKAILKIVQFDSKFTTLSDNLFRGALEYYYRWFPESFKVRANEQGVWMPFYAISKVPGWEDFGFKFKEGSDEIGWDDAHNIITFRYTEPMTWWMAMPKEMPRTYEAALARAKELAAKGDRMAQGLLTSGHQDEQGNYGAILLDTPWCNGAVWSLCDLPGLSNLARQKKLLYSDQYPITSFDLKWNDSLADKLYSSKEKGQGCDGEYIDSSEGYVTSLVNYRREHFAGAQCPLVFNQENFMPGIFRGLIAFEYAQKMAKDIHARGKLMMANSTPGQFFWLVPLLDVAGTETNWNYGKRWTPMSDSDLLYRRAICGGKPYCFLMNSNFEDFTKECSEKFMKRSLAYGHFSGYFSADASTGHYFSRPELYDRDRPLFKKYIPLCKQAAEAGWQPITLADSADEKVYVERFGQKNTSNLMFTVFNDSFEEKTAEITFHQGITGFESGNKVIDLVSGRKYTIGVNNVVKFLLGSEEVVLLTPEK